MNKKKINTQFDDSAQYCSDLRKGNSNWDLTTKIRRASWNCVWACLFRLTPARAGNGLRLFLLRRFGALIHGDPLIFPSCKILMPWNLEVGDFSCIGAEVEIYNYGYVKIGAMTLISQYTYLCTGTHDYTHPFMPLKWKPITIGSECWIAAGVFVAPGVEINNGTVVGAMSVVTKSLPEWTVCAGNPCRIIKTRQIDKNLN